MAEPALDAARESGLVREEQPLLVMLSGGADSTCLLDVALRLDARVTALHVNHGLRPGADDDEQHCRKLCEQLGVKLLVESPVLPAAGNLQALARDARYSAAERLAEGDYAAAHTLSDQAETVLYRLAVSPGRRALLGMPPRRGRLVRPLLGLTRAETREHCRARGLTWREDPSNADPRFARARIRAGVMPVLEELNSAAERNIVATSRLLADEAEVLDRAADDALATAGFPAAQLAELRRLPPALARLALRRLAEQAAGRDLPLSRADADRVLALGGAGTQSLDMGGGLRAVAEYGTLRFTTDPDAATPDAVPLPIPGSARFGQWEVEARKGGGGDVVLIGETLGPLAMVRAWQPGDRMRPLGLGGSKSLQDLFTDRKVPRALRRTLPVVEAGGEIVWVAGVAVGERFTPAHMGWDWLAKDDAGLISLSAKRVG